LTVGLNKVREKYSCLLSYIWMGEKHTPDYFLPHSKQCHEGEEARLVPFDNLDVYSILVQTPV
jgi:hypothetical protein